MAKGNMFQGMARGKVGDVVFSRLNGEQISRVRNRRPRNPRTNAQLYQRAVMATVMQAYSAGKVIFDHSFEGKEVGAQNQGYFMMENAKILRSKIAEELSESTTAEDAIAAVVGPGIKAPVPNIYKVSEGSLINNIFIIQDADMRIHWPSSLNVETSKLSDYVAAVGFDTKDIFTIVFFYALGNETPLFTLDADVKFANHYPAGFGYATFRVKTSFTEEENKIAFESTFGDIFTLDSFQNCTPNVILQTQLISEYVNFGNFVPSSGNCGVSAAIIRSRENEDLRSTETMEIIPWMEQRWTIRGSYLYGIKTPYVLDAWKMGTGSLGNSDLILEGGDV